MRTRTAAVAFLAFLGFAGPVLAAEDTVAHVVFEPGRFAAITAPIDLDYRLELQGRGIEEAPTSPMRVEVRSVGEGGAKEVWLDLFEGTAHRSTGPLEAREQNPVLLIFLQLDVAEMGKLTGGAAGYFQQQIRRAFSESVPSEAVTVEVDGKSVPATRVTIRPFQHDPQIARFPQFRDKSYAFTVSDGVPGGIWQVIASTPDPKTGDMVLEKSMTFEGARPRG